MQRIGLDIAALNKQVAEKQSRTEASKGEDAMYLEAMKVKGDLVRQAEEIVQNDRRAQQKECVDFSLQNLRTEQRREFYLNDPNMLKKETPARVPGIVPPISSMQKFQGELDLDPQKKKERRQNTCDWLAAQVAEKKLKAELEKDLDRKHDEALSRADQYRNICEAAVHQDRHQEVLETARENIAMASARSNRQLSARDRLLAAKTEHMKNVMEHNLIREKHDYSIGLTGRKRDYKRCSYEEECKAWEVNKNLAQAKRDRARNSVDNDGFYSQIGMTFEYLGNLNEAQWTRERLDRRQQIDETRPSARWCHPCCCASGKHQRWRQSSQQCLACHHSECLLQQRLLCVLGRCLQSKSSCSWGNRHASTRCASPSQTSSRHTESLALLVHLALMVHRLLLEQALRADCKRQQRQAEMQGGKRA